MSRAAPTPWQQRACLSHSGRRTPSTEVHGIVDRWDWLWHKFVFFKVQTLRHFLRSCDVQHDNNGVAVIITGTKNK
jgi:hypothetical protein